MSSGTRVAATLDDLRRVEGKAELIKGRIEHLMPTGFRPGRVGARIFRSLDDHAEATGRGVALPDNVGFAIPELPSGRESFSPDAAYHLGPLPSNPMRFVEGPRHSPWRSGARTTTETRRRPRGGEAGRLLRGRDRDRLGCRSRQRPCAEVLPGFARPARGLRPRPGGRCRARRPRLEDGGGPDLRLTGRCPHPPRTIRTGSGATSEGEGPLRAVNGDHFESLIRTATPTFTVPPIGCGRRSM